MKGGLRSVAIMAVAVTVSGIFSSVWTDGRQGGGFRTESDVAFAEEPALSRHKQKDAISATVIEQLAAELEKERTRLKEKEELLALREEHLLALQKEIEGKIDSLKKIRLTIEKDVKRLNEFEQERLLKLVKVYESAPPEEAGNLISKLEPDLAAKILLKMNDAKAGKLWAFVSPEQAVKISEKLYQGKGEKGAH